MRIRKRHACISSACNGAAAQESQAANGVTGAVYPQPVSLQSHNIFAGCSSSLRGQLGDGSPSGTLKCQKQVIDLDDEAPSVFDRNLERSGRIAEQELDAATGSSTGGHGPHASSLSALTHAYASMRFPFHEKSFSRTTCDDVQSHDYHLLQLHDYSPSSNMRHGRANMQAERAPFLQTDLESCIIKGQLEKRSSNGNTPVCRTVTASSKQLRIQGEECISSIKTALKADQVMMTTRQPKHTDNRQVGMLTTSRATLQLPNNHTHTSSLSKWDHVDDSNFMLTDKELGNNGELQQMATDLETSMEALPHSEDQAAKLKILEGEAKRNLERINAQTVDRVSARHDENEDKQDQAACMDKRCSRKGGGGWQCKNMRPGDGSSSYCDYHQVHRATSNACNKTSKENKRKRGWIVAEKTSQPLQNMVDVKLLELPFLCLKEHTFLPLKEHTYENVQAYDTVSSIAGTISKRMFQAAGCKEKQRSFNPGKDHVELATNSAALPGLVEADTPKTLHAHQAADSESQGHGSNFKKRRAEDATVVLEAAGCNILSIMASDGKCATGDVLSGAQHGANDANVGIVRKSDDDIDDPNQEVEEIMKCKWIDRRGSQCKSRHKQNKMYCKHHQMNSCKGYCQENLKECSRDNSKHTLSLYTGKHSNALPVISPRCNVQDENSTDASKVSIATEDTVVGSVKSNLQENKSVHVIQRLDSNQGQTQLQDYIMHNEYDHGLHQQLQQQQLWWWQSKQHSKDDAGNSQRSVREQSKLLALPRRSERKLIIDICKATAPEKLTKDCSVEVTQSKIEHTSSKPSDMLTAKDHSSSTINAVPQVFHMHEASQSYQSQQQRCKRHDGRGWQCKTMCAQGKLYCEHHLKLKRRYIEMVDAETNNRPLPPTQPCKEPDSMASTINHTFKVDNGHVNATQIRYVNLESGHDKPEAVTAPQKEHMEHVQRCGRHDGRGWQCKSTCRQGSIFCDYHQEKIRLNHATWNAKMKLLQQLRKQEVNIHEKLEEQEQDGKRTMEEMLKEEIRIPLTGTQHLLKKKMRSLKDIEACSIN